MNYLSVCSGIEAASCAWHDLGWKPVAFAEIEAFPSAVLAHHYPSVPNLGDLTKWERWHVADFDVLVGGTPCQDYSISGPRTGLAGERGQLTLDFVRLARAHRPRWLVWENVPGVFSSNNGHDFAAVLSDLAGCDVQIPPGGWKNTGIVASPNPSGYGIAWVVRDAEYIRTRRHPRAVPQRRRRLFVVGYLGDWRPAAEVLLERASLRGDPPPRREAGKRAAPTLAARTRGGGGQGSDFEIDEGLIPATSHTLRAEGFDATEDGTGRGTPLVPAVSGAIAARDHKMPRAEDDVGIIPVAFDCKGGEVQTETRGAAPTLRAMGHSSTHPNGGGQVALQMGWMVRRLTPRECERLQGFPDDWTLVPYRGRMASDGPRYKALGNSMAVNVMAWIGDRIDKVAHRIKAAQAP